MSSSCPWPQRDTWYSSINNRNYFLPQLLILTFQQATKENNQAIVNASFHVTQWNVSPFGTGLSRLKNQQCVFGGDVLRSGYRYRHLHHLSVIVGNIMFHLINV